MKKTSKYSHSELIFFMQAFARKIAETALKECRPEGKKTENVEWLEHCEGYNQCLSEFDERVKSFLE